jgi:tetratricopeptide (TPR) repeat protein
LEKIGGLYKETGEKIKALAAYDSSAHYYTLGKDSSNLKGLLSDIGDVYNTDKQYQKAFDYYFKWHHLNIASKNKSDIVNSYYQLSEASYYFNNDTSIKYGLACLQLAKEIGDKNNEYYAASILGQNYYKNYRIDEGDVYYKQALNVAIEQKNKKLEANCYRSLGFANNSKLDFNKAIPLFEKALHIYDSLGEKTALPITYRALGSAIQSKGDFYEARSQYQKSIDIAYSINSRADVGYGFSASLSYT